MTDIRYSGTCTACGTLHTRTLHTPWSSDPDEDFFGARCTNPKCDPRNDAFLTRDPDDDDA